MGWKIYFGDVMSEGVFVVFVDRFVVMKFNLYVFGIFFEGILVGDLYGLVVVFVRVR